MQRDTEVSRLIVTDRWHTAIPMELSREPSMRTFGVVMLLGFGVLGGLSVLGWWRRAQEWRLVFGVVLGFTGLTVFVWSLISPRSLPPVYRAWMELGLRIGAVMTTVLLTTIHLIIVTPVGRLMRAKSGDPLDRTLSRGPGTYWRRRGGAPMPDDYKHMS